MMFDNSLESLTLGGVSRSESVSDLNKEVRDQVKTPRKSLPDGDSLQAPAKQYGIGKYTVFLCQLWIIFIFLFLFI